MRYDAWVDRSVQTTTIVLAESCHTDSTPMVSEIFFNNTDFDVQSPTFALACVVLTGAFVGEQAEFAHQSIGIDVAHALSVICPQVVSVTPVNGMDRGHSLAELDIVCTPARRPMPGVVSADQVPLVPIDWSGDFVDPGTRSSAGFRQGRIFTNAGLVADETTASIAMALMHGGALCRNLYAPLTPGRSAEAFLPMQAGLALIGIALHLTSS